VVQYSESTAPVSKDEFYPETNPLHSLDKSLFGAYTDRFVSDFVTFGMPTAQQASLQARIGVDLERLAAHVPYHDAKKVRLERSVLKRAIGMSDWWRYRRMQRFV
jgi:hypothetical protein